MFQACITKTTIIQEIIETCLSYAKFGGNQYFLNLMQLYKKPKIYNTTM